MKKTLTLSVLVATALMSGCSNKGVIIEEGKSEIKYERVSRDLSNDWGNTGLSGAAYNQSAYVDVLGNDMNTNLVAVTPTEHTDKTYMEKLGGDKGINNSALLSAASEAFAASATDKNSSDGLKAGTSGKGYSVYELSRWERFCNEGKGMDEADWIFVEAQGEENAPSELFYNCTAPAYNYEYYLSTWIDFCEGYELSATDKKLVSNSVRPTSVREICKF